MMLLVSAGYAVMIRREVAIEVPRADLPPDSVGEVSPGGPVVMAPSTDPGRWARHAIRSR
jgi:hypothetical protein